MINDPVNHPGHYTHGKVECIDAIESVTTYMTGKEAFLTGQTIKYMWRWRLKNGVEDLKKARWYLDRLIAQQEAEEKKEAEDEANRSKYLYNIE